jgi:hypothetical protein
MASGIRVSACCGQSLALREGVAGSWVVGMVIYGLPRRRAGRLEHEMAVRLRLLILACW